MWSRRKGPPSCCFFCFKYKFINLNWRLITLQYCIGFAIYGTGIHVFAILNPPPSSYHPSGSSQCTSPKHPVSCIKPGLATHFIYDIIHVSMPFSQIIPPSPSPTSCCFVHTQQSSEAPNTLVFLIHRCPGLIFQNHCLCEAPVTLRAGLRLSFPHALPAP